MVGFLFVYGYSMARIRQKVNPIRGFLTNLTQSGILDEVLLIEVAQFIAEQNPVVRQGIDDLCALGEVFNCLNSVDQLKKLDRVLFEFPEEGD